MFAAVDVGSNTVRMLIGECLNRQVHPATYYRQITRLGARYQPGIGLTAESMERTLAALREFDKILQQKKVANCRTLGTAALRRAENRQYFQELVANQTHLSLEIISGEEEALLTAHGALSVIRPIPDSSLIVDIGGGSTEFVFQKDGMVLFRQSYPVGVVRLCEEVPDRPGRQVFIDKILDNFSNDLAGQGLPRALIESAQLVGTAGTITTLAAMAQQMTVYDWRKINNSILLISWLRETEGRLKAISEVLREQLPGMEKGRGDLILPGLQLLLSLMRRFAFKSLKVADFGLLEGILLGMG